MSTDIVSKVSELIGNVCGIMRNGASIMPNGCMVIPNGCGIMSFNFGQKSVLSVANSFVFPATCRISAQVSRVPAYAFPGRKMSSIFVCT